MLQSHRRLQCRLLSDTCTGPLNAISQLWCLKDASHLQACLGVQKAVLITGTTGVGKSVIISGALEKLRGAGAVTPYTVNFSAQTKAVDAQVR